jgi:fucose 4-O-acetylase-like acetyltransferase
MVQKIFAGLLAGLMLAGVFVIYYLVRGRAFVATLKASSPEMANMSDNTLYLMFLGGFVFAALVLGLLSVIVYGFFGPAEKFRLLAGGLALLASVLAIISRTPMPVDKVFMNLAVASVLGGLIPVLVGKLAG